mmetsp:Transcript_14094/g.29167  ORF Transcript_14094/g.29167 Transcript_14094/m.29167 type:complete len:129 (+) Transcript_14094:422-808(+)
MSCIGVAFGFCSESRCNMGTPVRESSNPMECPIDTVFLFPHSTHMLPLSTKQGELSNSIESIQRNPFPLLANSNVAAYPLSTTEPGKLSNRSKNPIEPTDSLSNRPYLIAMLTLIQSKLPIDLIQTDL